MPSKVSYLAPTLRNTDSTLLALDVLGFSQFKRSYAQILDDRARDNFGAMNKRTFLQAIEKPFLKSFTAENIKKSFELVGLHPFNPTVIKTSQMAPSIPTSIGTPSLTDEPSPVKAMKAAFTSILDNATLPVPSIPTLHIEPDPSLSPPAPPAMLSIDANDSSTPPHQTMDMTSPQKVAQELLQGTSAAWIVNSNPITSSVPFRPYSTPSLTSIRLNLPPHTSSHYSPDDPLLIPHLSAENAALREHIKKLDHIIASQHVQLTLNSLAVRKFQHQLYEKEQKVKDRKRQRLFDGKAQIVTAPEFQKLVKDMQEKLHLEKEQKEVRATERRKKADAKEALEHWKGQLIERYNENMASYNEECATLAADGVPKKFWPKKPTHPTRGRKAKQLKPPPNDSPLPSVPTIRPQRTVAHADLIVDLGDGPEDSEYEDFEDDFDV